MSRKVFYNAIIVNEDRIFNGCVVTDGHFIDKIIPTAEIPSEGEGSLNSLMTGADFSFDCCGRMLMPGVIDTHVHFRDPGLTEKADMLTESRAAVAGGVTSFIDMPNTAPPTVSSEAVEAKKTRAAEVSEANYGFFIGATNDNLPELLSADYSKVAGVKLFLGSSTGNMLVDADDTLERIFADVKALIAVHAEDEATIAEARENLRREYNDGDIPVERHPDVRPREACVKATKRALDLAEKHGARLHICHVSTADELKMIKEARLRGVKVTAETCPQYLLFDRNDFESLGARIKCNPAIKDPSDRIALQRQLLEGGAIDTIATDHAPHLLSQKEGNALAAASGMPMIQFSLLAMLELAEIEPELESLSPMRIARLMSHNPAEIFGIEKRGYIREGYYADLVLVERLALPRKVSDDDVHSRCAWTPLDGTSLSHSVTLTIVNGDVVYDRGSFFPSPSLPLEFKS